MALETLHFVQGPSRTPLLFIPRYLTNIFPTNNLQKETSRELTISKVDAGKLVDSFSPRDGPVSNGQVCADQGLRDGGLRKSLPTPPHPGVFGNLMLWRSHLLLWRSQLLGVPMAWRRRQAMAKWRLGRRKLRGSGGGPEWGPRTTSFARSATWPWPGAAARPDGIPLIGNAIPLIGNAVTLIGSAITLNGNAGVVWGGGVYVASFRTAAPVNGAHRKQACAFFCW